MKEAKKRFIVNAGSAEDVLCYLKNNPPTNLEDIKLEIEHERSNKNRLIVLKKLATMQNLILSKEPAYCVVCGDLKPKNEMHNVDTLNGKADGVWVYACRNSMKFGYNYKCYSHYDRSINLSTKNKFFTLVDWSEKSEIQ